jgi:acyl-CoA hydrolase
MKLPERNWESAVVPPQAVLKKIRPGMSIFLTTGVAEPRTLVRQIMGSKAKNLEDLELVQLVSFGEAISIEALKSKNFRLKTFFSGWAADRAIEEGLVDLVPSRFQKIPELISAGQIPLDMAIIQVTPPNDAGYCSLGVAVDVAWEAMEKATIKVGEINTHVPRTFGDTFVPISEFDHLVLSEELPIYFNRWSVDETTDKVATNVAALIDDESCLAFSIGPLYEALATHLKTKRHLGVHSPFFTDPLMDLIRSGAVTNRRKESYRGKSLTSYAFGTPELFAWLNNNPLVEFQRIDKVFSPQIIGRNSKFVNIIAARKIDLYGRVGFHIGKGNVATGPSEVLDFFHGAELSEKGCSIFALTSRDPKGRPNILASIADWPNQFGLPESVSTVVTEHGTAYLEGRTIRERAQALIEIAHPDDREMLIEEARKRKIVYPDQIFLAGSARLYPKEISAAKIFKGDLQVRFRAIRPSDEEGMRHLFYRFSEETCYYRYFQTIRSMPHAKMQEYVNVDWSRDMSVVGLVGEEGRGRIIAEGRYLRIPNGLLAELVFWVDESFQSRGIATFLYSMLIRLAKARGLKGFVADVLFDNHAMMKVFHKGELPVRAQLESGVYHLTIPFETE